MQVPEEPQLGPPTLLCIAKAAIKRWVSYLNDLGSIPIEMLLDALAAATPEELAYIEDATLTGVAARDISGYTWHLWHQHCQSGSLLKMTTMPVTLPPLKVSSSIDIPKVEPADYRKVYWELVSQLDAKRNQTGKRLKEMRSDQEQKRAARCVQVSKNFPFPLFMFQE